MSKLTEKETENKLSNWSTFDNILFISVFILVVAFWIWFTIFCVKNYKVDIAAAEIEKEQRIAACELVREFVENKSVVDVKCERHIFGHQDDVYDFTVTVEGPEGQSETKTFTDYHYIVLDSTDTFWHINVTKDGYIEIYEPKVYTSN